MKLLQTFLLLIFTTMGLQAEDDPARKSLTPDEIVQRFAAKEAEFRDVWAQYTYKQRILFQVLRNNEPAEQREMIIEVFFTGDGERQTRVLSDRGGLRSVQVTSEDISDATSMQPFVLTTKELGNYEIVYRGEERVDELDTYVFDVEPLDIERGERYFEGRIWVDDLDFQIVMTEGKIVPDLGNNKFPKFTTIREQIDGDYWFPTWTEADDVLTFSSWNRFNRVHVRQLITYWDFQKFEVGTSIQFGDVKEDPEEPAP